MTSKIYKSLTGTTAKRLAKVSLATISLLGLIGIGGGIQQGRISLMGGLLVAALCLGLEYICLKNVD